MSNIDTLDQFMNTASEAHSFQDGATAGVVTGLIVTGSPLLSVLAVFLGFGTERVGRKAILGKVKEMLRVKDIRDAPEYFLLGWLPTSAITAGGVYLAQEVILPVL